MSNFHPIEVVGRGSETELQVDKIITLERVINHTWSVSPCALCTIVSVQCTVHYVTVHWALLIALDLLLQVIFRLTFSRKGTLFGPRKTMVNTSEIPVNVMLAQCWLNVGPTSTTLDQH